MADTSKGAYTFLSYARRGAVTGIKDVDDPTKTLASRGKLAVSLTVQGLTGAVGTNAVLYGPGDVTGIDPALIGRMQPKPGTPDFEPNYFAAVELKQPDFPWMLTPAKANADGQLRPWLCLVAIEKSDGVLNTEPTLVLPQVHVDDADEELPPPADSFAWAHIQLTGSVSAGDPLETVVDTNPERVVARLLCPRRLDEGTTYHACVVPLFMAGRQAGLGEPVTATDLTYAWAAGDTDFWLPVYHQWEFTTGARGDFESLVRMLQPGEMPPEVGTRPMDIGDPGGGLPAAPQSARPVEIGLEGALRVPGAGPTAWPRRTMFLRALRKLLDAPARRSATAQSLPLVPPIYGRWHAARETVPADRGPNDKPYWLRELNLDPRNRVAAALGTQVVQERQDQLMERAWQQVGEIERANQALRQAQMARSAGVSMHARHLSGLSPEAIVQITEPVHARVIGGTAATMRAVVRDSCLPQAVLSPGFRRLMRPRGPVARRWRRAAAARRERPRQTSLLRRLASGALSVVPDRTVQSGAVTVDLVSERLRAHGRGGTAADLGFAQLTEDTALHAPAQEFRVLTAEDGERPQVTGGADDAVAAAFRDAAAAHQADVMQEGPAGPGCDSLALPGAAQNLLGLLDPRTTVPARIGARLRVPEGVWDKPDPLEPIMAAPEFPEPMYEPLRDMSQDWLLPGLDRVPPNTISVLETNARFVESYMVGLNHEMARELLWREYPTDQRGTCFRQFWDLSAVVPAPVTDAEREALKDIDEIHTWPAAKQLGDARARGKSKEARLVLLIRGELLQRYPDAVIYAVKALRQPGGKRVPSTAAGAERYPVFRGTLPQDVTFLAFDLTASEARGRGRLPGWFFVIQQQPTEPRFGLDEAGWQSGQPAGWRDLTWGHLVTQNQFAGMTHAPVSGSRPESWAFSADAGVRWGKQAESAHIAYIALQRPVRVAIHADDMLASP